MSILIVQQRLQRGGFDPGPLDGQWGPRTESALDAAIPVRGGVAIAWGARVSHEFREKLITLCARQQLIPDYLMACIAWESDETFSASVSNRAGSGATGLIQFMPLTAIGLGTTTAALARMTAVQQLDFVESYFRPYRGRLRTLSDHYMAILWPAAIGKPEHHVLWDKATRPTTYGQNAGLDGDRDGRITKAEAAAKVEEKLIRGREFAA